MNHKKGFAPIIIILIIIGVLAAAGGGYYAVKKFQKPEIKACTQEAKICPDGTAVGRTGPNCDFALCPEAKTDETADWKTYRNEEYGFEVRYPKDWKADMLWNDVYVEEGGVRLVKFSADFLANSDWGDNINELNRGFDSSWNFWQRNLEEARKNPNQPWPAFLHDKVSEGWNILSRKEIIFLGKPSLQVIFQDANKVGTSKLILTPYLNTDAVYEIELVNYFNKDNINEKLDQILSTFKFTPQ